MQRVNRGLAKYEQRKCAKSVPRIAPSVCSETTPFAGEEGEVNYRENRFVRLCFLLFLHVFCVCAFCGMRSAGASSVPPRNFNLRIRHKSLNLKTSRVFFAAFACKPNPDSASVRPVPLWWIGGQKLALGREIENERETAAEIVTYTHTGPYCK